FVCARQRVCVGTLAGVVGVGSRLVFRPSRHLLVLIGASAMLRCGGSNPASPSGGGVKLQGVVLQRSSGTAASASVSASSAQAGKIVVTVQENPALSVTVSGNGTFEIQNLPAGGFTLVFSVNGVVVGQITITALSEGTTIRIVVKLSAQEVELVDLETDDDNGGSVGGGNQGDGDDGTKPARIEGGHAGSST